MEEVYPKIRNTVEALPIEHAGRKAVLLRDRLQVAQEIVIPMGVAGFIPFFDGKNSLRDIQVALMRGGGFELVSVQEIERVVQALDTYHYLENEGFRKHLQGVEEDFRNNSCRASSLAGKSYPQDPDRLREEIDGFFSHLEGPGEGTVLGKNGKVTGIIAPHIDYHRGGPCYAWAYKAMAEACESDLFVILGTAHCPTDRPFVFTDKDFDTPLGLLRTEKEVVRGMVEESGVDLFKDQIIHRAEHSIELQAVMLRHLYRERDIRIIPILCGPLHPEGDSGTPCEEVHRVIAAMRKILGQAKASVCLVASADLAHMGPQFGDSYPMTEADLPGLREADSAMLEHVLNLNPEGFLKHITAEGDRRKICGLPPIYTMLHLLDAGKAHMLRYSQAYNPQATVTFASVAFTRQDHQHEEESAAEPQLKDF
ncbi:MAG: AmmeMemoRadiSam system protein B [Pseudomonadota bacterium]